MPNRAAIPATWHIGGFGQRPDRLDLLGKSFCSTTAYAPELGKRGKDVKDKGQAGELVSIFSVSYSKLILRCSRSAIILLSHYVRAKGIERSLFMLAWLEDPAVRRRVTAGSK
jgi:hypothetical protein